ncbi:pyridoxamine 5'-phosphate oxidase family protein [Sphingopyxis terrae]|uniref:pyridoxamine 5'-phosphate oxidase family protein n=1 Tax=Sphingopyxis terrae TaxID=33052 RepID=UPI002A0D06CF|nr:pyridoxamine 5'-phosphate oxidase family protein [Sphingopyxis terrae]MDX8356117.1 pyridoxamine 5'-phosphate oxidase family protein [Sphingopyxis terrae]
MAQHYLRTLFTDAARRLQAQHGSRASYARMEADSDGSDALTARELDFIAARDSFYLGSITAEGWPYIQHRGGPPGFLRPLGGNRLGFADFTGNRQYISTANLAENPRVSLFLMDYPNRRRLKLIGEGRIVDIAEDPALVTSLMPDGYRATPERGFVIDVAGFDWNCPQHITPRFTETEISAAVRPMAAELNQLRAELAALRAAQSRKENQ